MSPRRRQEEQLQASRQLLSMRCEASRSMRRRRGTQTLLHWMHQEPLEANNKRRIIPFLNSSSNHSKEQTEDQASPEEDTPKQPKREPKWRLWMPISREDLLPSNSAEYSNASSSSSHLFPQQPEPALVLRKQLLEKSQRRQLLQKASRNLFQQNLPAYTPSQSNLSLGDGFLACSSSNSSSKQPVCSIDSQTMLVPIKVSWSDDHPLEGSIVLSVLTPRFVW
jgi:hypothetical protein